MTRLAVCSRSHFQTPNMLADLDTALRSPWDLIQSIYEQQSGQDALSSIEGRVAEVFAELFENQAALEQVRTRTDHVSKANADAPDCLAASSHLDDHTVFASTGGLAGALPGHGTGHGRRERALQMCWRRQAAVHVRSGNGACYERRRERERTLRVERMYTDAPSLACERYRLRLAEGATVILRRDGAR